MDGAGKGPMGPRPRCSLRYGRVAELIGLVQQAGLSRVGFITEAAAAK